MDTTTRRMMSGASAPPSAALKASFQAGALANPLTVSSAGIDIGAPFPGRVIVIAAYVHRGTNITWDITNLTFGGLTPTRVCNAYGSVGRGRAGIYVLQDATLTTGDLVVTADQTINTWGYQIYVLNGVNATPYGTYAVNGGSSPEAGPWTYTVDASTGNVTIACTWNYFSTANQDALIDFSIPTSHLAAVQAGTYCHSLSVGYGTITPGIGSTFTASISPAVSTVDGIFKLAASFQPA